MYIRNIYIAEYGSLKDREFRFSNGINLIEGNNESGKSTILSFIRFMLYGMPKRATGDSVGERERGLSWENGVANGTMELISNGKSYRIERRGQLRGGHGTRESYTEKCTVVDVETGAEIFEGEVPGKVFLGITSEVFTTTACIRQLECTDMNSDEINASIENLLFSADEEIDTQKIQTKLDELRRTLLYKKGKGGKLYQLETEKSLLENRLETAKQTAETIIAKEASVEKLKIISEKAKKQAEQAEAQLRLYESATALKRFETLHTYEEQYREQQKELEKLCHEKGYRDALPDRDTLAVIDRFSSALNDASVKQKLAAATLENATHAPCGNRQLAAFYEKTDKEGGKDTICSSFLRFIRKCKNAVWRAILCFVFTLLFLALVTFSFVSDIPKAYYGSFDFLPYVILGLGILFGIFGILSVSVAAKAKKTASALLEKIGLSHTNISEHELAEHIEICRQNHQLCQKYDTNLSMARQAYEESNNALEKAVQNTIRMLASVGIVCSSDKPTELASCLEHTHATFFDICNEREKIEGKSDTLRALIDELNVNLKDMNESSLASCLGNQIPSEILAEMDIEKIRLAYNYSKTQHMLNEQKKIALEKELIALHSTAETPARLDAKLTEITNELAENRLKYDAIVMAYDTLSSASENLRRCVTPKLRIRASERMERLTDGKYRDLGISTDMKITVVAEHMTRSIDALSKGTRDVAYISLRIALAELICAENMPPLMFDESFTQLDDNRTFAMLNMLLNYTVADGTQSLLFTGHKREGDMVKKIGQFNYITLDT